MPNAEPRFARVAAMIGDPTRSRMLAALLDGRMMTAGEIARAADVTPQTASVHLAKLADAGLVARREQGRHRYFRIADGDVAHALEALAVVAEPCGCRDSNRTKWSQDRMKPLRHARTCYGHLAGELGVALHDSLVSHGAIVAADDGYALDADGVGWLADLGFDATHVRATPRGIAYPCVDWSERRDHLAGPLATALLEHFLEKRWLVRAADSRALAINAPTRQRFERFLSRR
jgi:DNA-binding transcriptional ArsR family regulator